MADHPVPAMGGVYMNALHRRTNHSDRTEPLTYGDLADVQVSDGAVRGQGCGHSGSRDDYVFKPYVYRGLGPFLPTRGSSL